MKRSLLLAAVACAACTEPAVTMRVIRPPEGPHWSAASPKSCQGGCTFERKKGDELTSAQLDALFAEIDKTPVGTESLAVDTVLFHDSEARARLATAPLSDGWRKYFTAELSRRHAWYSLRIVDEHGVVRAELPEQLMALGSKLHMEMSGERLQPFNANGTLVRVGQQRIWQRM